METNERLGWWGKWSIEPAVGKFPCDIVLKAKREAHGIEGKRAPWINMMY